jgi:ubiquinone/menaquinone biosynthesis C-methylase UbiE
VNWREYWDSLGAWSSVGQVVAVDYVSKLPARSVLDLACGPGNIGADLKLRSKWRVVGVDFAFKCGEFCTGFTVPFVCADMLTLPFKSGSFEVGLCLRSLNYVEDVSRWVSEVDRVVAGWVVVSFSDAFESGQLLAPARRAGWKVEVESVKVPDTDASLWVFKNRA